MEFYKILPFVLAFLIFMVGGYVFMFLHIMRNDPRELEFRKDKGVGNELIPKKH